MADDVYKADGRSNVVTRRWLSGWLVLVLVTILGWQAAHANQEYLDPEDAFVLSAAINKQHHIDVHFKIAPEYYMYRERFQIDSAQPGLLGETQFPDGLRVYDPTFDAEMEVYRDAVTLRIALNEQALTGAPLTIGVTSQGCADAGLCYSPSVQTLELVPGAQGYQVQGQYAAAAVPTPEQVAQAQLQAQTGTALDSAPESAFSLSDVGLAQYLKQASWYQIVLLSFAFGVLLSFTPCVLPMVPILLAIIAGQKRDQPSRAHGLLMAFAFVLGLSLVYTVLGVAAGLLGAGLAGWLQTPWVLGLFALFLGIFGLSMLDVFTLQVPSALQGWLNERLNRIPGGRFGGVFIMGMLSALIVGPCVAAPLAGVLLFISQTGDVVLGGSALFALAWGSGVLLLVLGASSGAFMPKAGAWMNHVKTAFGAMLLATAWWMVAPVLPASVAVVGWALWLAWVAMLLGAFAQPVNTGALRALAQAVAGLLALWAALALVSVASGVPSVLSPLAGLQRAAVGLGAAQGPTVTFERISTIAELDQRLAQANKPILLDFYADWCVSCLEMEKFTFTDVNVAQRMHEFELLQVDVTANTAQDRELLKRFSLFGPPGILFFDRQGQYLEQARVIGFKSAAQFAPVLDAVLRNG